jgi:hypothetical protein
MLGLNYLILDADSTIKGIRKIIWNGMWKDKTENAVGNTIENYDLIRHQVTNHIKTIDIFFAPTKLTTDMRRHIEGCIALNLRKKYPDLAIFFPDDNRMQTKPKRLGEKVVITADEEILGLDDEIII